MKKKAVAFLLCAIITITIFPLAVHADTGPKPSIKISFKNMGNDICYGTLLSKYDSTGPASAWDGNNEHIYDNGISNTIWQAFVDYQDADGFYFLQWGWLVSECKSLSWTYYPPSPFKILLYYPETETYVVSEICEKYAFDSYFTVNMSGITIGSVGENEVLIPRKSYDYTLETLSLVCRIIVTIMLEIGIALLFGFRTKKMLLFISGVNIITQVALNIALNVTNYYQGSLGFVMNYILLELIVFAVEAILYVIFMKKISAKSIRAVKSIAYALTANAASFVIGLAIAKIVPGIF